MDNADVYLLLLRPTRVPVAGEALSEGFQGQVQLGGWSWGFHNEEEKSRAERDESKYSEARASWEAGKAADANKKLMRLNDRFERNDLRRMKREFEQAGQGNLSEAEYKAKLDSMSKQLGDWDKNLRQKEANFDKELRHTLKQYESAEEETRAKSDKLREEVRGKMREQLEDEAEKAKDNKNFEFTFSKRVDIATTQLLNSMKAGDVFPSGVLTIHQRSSNQGMSLVINVQRVRLLHYSLKVEVTDTMTDMREEWTAEFGSLAYVYKNRDGVYAMNSASQAAPRILTQNTVRAFTMKNIGSPI